MSMKEPIINTGLLQLSRIKIITKIKLNLFKVQILVCEHPVYLSY